MKPKAWHFQHLLRVAAALLALACGLCAAQTDALVTGVSGRVLRADSQPLQPFVRLADGDRLRLEANARIELVFPASGREERWSGAGTLAITAAGARGPAMSAPEVRLLPEWLVRQIARMPDPSRQSKAGAFRMRELPGLRPAPAPLEEAEAQYLSLRAAADPGDLNPELYWLASLFERGEFDRIGAELGRLRADRPGDERILGIDRLYRRAIAGARRPRSEIE